MGRRERDASELSELYSKLSERYSELSERYSELSEPYTSRRGKEKRRRYQDDAGTVIGRSGG